MTQKRLFVRFLYFSVYYRTEIVDNKYLNMISNNKKHHKKT